MESRNVYLFGPEASLGWKASTTESLTKMILKKGFRKMDNTTITSHIYETLKEQYKDTEIHYHDILDYIDTLYYFINIGDYYVKEIAKTGEPIARNAYLTGYMRKEIRRLSEYEITDINTATDTYSLVIPGYNQIKEYNIPMEIPPDAKYFQLLYAELVNIIVDNVSKYSYHSDSRDLIFTPENEKLNKSFTDYMFDRHKNRVLRMYTTGYERIFKVLLARSGMPVFEGFNIEDTYVTYNKELKPDLKRITADADCNCFYNLNGSAYWRPEFTDENMNSTLEYYLTAGANKLNSTVSVKADKTRRFITSNILVDSQKLQKATLSPFRQMYSAFERDCMNANRIYLIGYKFRDVYINDILTYIRKNIPEVRYDLIDSSFESGNEMLQFFMKWNAKKDYHYESSLGNFGYGNSGDYKVTVFKKSFKEYLEMVEGWNWRPDGYTTNLNDKGI